VREWQVLDLSHNPQLTSCGLAPLLSAAPHLERLFLAHSTKVPAFPAQ
jgi:hypothetical protein